MDEQAGRKAIAGIVLAAFLVAAVALATYAASPGAPIITFISPVSAAPGGDAFTLTVNGAGFVASGTGSVVQWNGIALATTFVSADQLSASVPAALIAAGGTAWITVANPGCSGACSLTSNVIYFPVGASSATLTFGALGAATLEAPPAQMAEGDFNGDGKLDLAVSNSSGNTVSIYLGNGDGTFQPPISFSTTTKPWGIAVGDLNGDGIPDLIIGSNSAAGLTVAVGNGLGGFTATTLPGGSCPTNPVLADVNHDGNLDIVVGNECGNGIGLYLGNGDGTFQAPVGIEGASRTNMVVVADFDGDDNLDIAGADANLGTADVYLGTGTGSFSAVTQYPATIFASSIATADFDGDGKLDLVVAGSLGNSGIVLLHGNGDGTFRDASTIANSTGLSSVIAAGDLNIDGNLDIVGITADGGVQAWLGNGDGTFQSPPPILSSGNGAGLLLGNFVSAGGLNVAAGFGYEVNVYAPTLTISPPSANFGNVDLNSAAQQVFTITNLTPETVNFTGASFAGPDLNDFSQTNKCSAPIAPAATCTLTVSFEPPVAGARSGNLLIADSAPGSPQRVNLSGFGVAAPLASISTVSLVFGNQNLGVISAAQLVNVENTGTAPLTGLNGIVAGVNAADFGQTNNCPDPLNVWSVCTFTVTFAPTDLGPRSAMLQIVDNAPDSPQVVMLSGTGILSPSQLAFFTAPPAAISAGDSVGMVSVAVETSRSTVATSSNASIQVTITGPNSFSSSLTQMAASGLATFNFGNTLLNVTGQYTVTAASANLSPAVATIVVSAQGSAARMNVSGYPSPTFATVPHNFTVSATDIFGNPIANYSGTVSLTSTDPQAVLTPSTYTFTPADMGAHTFTGTLITLGTQSISATDQTLAGTEALIQVSAPPQFEVNTLADDSGMSPCTGNDACSLRSAINQSDIAGAGGISLDTSQLEGSAPFVSSLAGVVLELSANISITGPGASQWVISANGGSSVFQVDAGANVSISGLTATAANGGNAGGAINNAGTLTLTNVAVANSVTAQDGGGIYNSGTLTLSSSQISGCTAQGNGGATANTGALAVYDSTIYGNTAVGNGGAIDNSGELAVPQSTLSGNTAADGAAIENEASGSLRVLQSTISANSAAGNAGGTVSNQSEANGAVTILNSVVAGNSAPGGDCLNCGAQAAFNLFGVAAANLQLGGLAENGGPTRTMLPRPGSPAIGAGSVELVTGSGVPQSLVNDQRGAGFARVVNGSVDLGAVQSNSGPAVSVTLASAASSVAGEPLSFTVSAFAAGGNPAATFSDSVHFTSSDAQAVLPADYTFVPADLGSHGFSVTLETSGSQTVTVTDTENVSVVASQIVKEKPAAAAMLSEAGGSGQSAAAGSAFAAPLQSKVSDAFGNGVPAIAVHFAAPASGASGTFAGGTNSVTVATSSAGIATAPEFTANSTAGQFTVTAAAASLNSIAFTLTNIDAGAPGYTVNANPSALTIVQGQSGSTVLTFTPLDGFAGTISLSCTGLPAGVDCVFDPAQAVMSGNNAAVAVTLTVNTTGTNGQLSFVWPGAIRAVAAGGSLTGKLLAALVGVFLLAAILAGIIFVGERQRARHAAAGFALQLIVLAAAGLAACGGVGSSSTSSQSQAATIPGVYSVNVATTAGTGTQTAAVMITIVEE